MNMQVNIRIVGKPGRTGWEGDAYTVYSSRLKPHRVDLETTWHKDNKELVRGVEGDAAKGHFIVFLDPNGKTSTSEDFEQNLFRWIEDGGSRTCFVIGGAEGLPWRLDEMRSFSQSHVLSLGQMTLTHQFARVMLSEQIYRAAEIRKGTKYHK